MEAIFEIIIQILLETILPVIGEMIFQIIKEASVSLGIDWNFKSSQKNSNYHKWLNFIIYALSGLLLGSLSLVVFPQAILRNQYLRSAGLFFIPLLVGLFTYLWSYVRSKQQLSAVDYFHLNLNSFLNGWIFALIFEFIRFEFTTLN